MANTTKVLRDNQKQLLVCFVFLFAFLLILFLRANFFEVDGAVNSWIPTIQYSWATTVAVCISFAFDTYSLLVVSVVVAAFLFWKNYRLQGLLLLGALGVDAVLVAGFKSLVQSPRPLNGLIVDSGYSFPSGHTVGSIVFCGLIAFFAWQHWKSNSPRALVISLTVVIVAVAGFDRLYLNVHWFSDVFGGCLLGIFWLVSSILIYKLVVANVDVHSNGFRVTSKVLFCLAIVVGAGLLIVQWIPIHLSLSSLTGFFQPLTNTLGLLTTIGYVGLFVIVFAESGFFAGFFLPGDSLLFTAGILASQDLFSIYGVAAIVVIGAILGDSFGYAFGRKVGPYFVKKESRFLNAGRVESVKGFFEKHGSKAIVIARFVPVARTFAPILAGASKMKYRVFLPYNILGALLWGVSISLIGFVAGEVIPDIEFFIYPIIAIIILISVLPWLVKFMQERISAGKQRQPVNF